MISDAGIARLLAEIQEDKEPGVECARLGCGYPAVLGPYCGLHKGMELASRRGDGAAPVRKTDERKR